MVKLPYWEMEPDNDAVSPFEIEIEGKGWRTNFCLSKRGEIYLVFSTYGDSVQMTIPEGGSYRVLRLDPRTGQETDLGSVPGEVQEIGLPKGEWVLLLRRTR